jgi:hypothetical protein
MLHTAGMEGRVTLRMAGTGGRAALRMAGTERGALHMGNDRRVLATSATGRGMLRWMEKSVVAIGTFRETELMTSVTGRGMLRLKGKSVATIGMHRVEPMTS